jgi:putative two-component system response regulator
MTTTLLPTIDSTTPAATAPPGEGITSPPNQGADLVSAARIAIVDDEPINVKVARKYLQAAGYSHFITTTDSTTALALLVAERPDVVLLDIMMPEVDGIEVLQSIRAHKDLRHIPVLILTASTDLQTKTRALNAGATDFLPKPFDPSDLLPRIRNALTVKAHHDHLERYSEDLERQVRARTIELELSRLQVVYCLARAAEYRDDSTGHHVIRVGRYASRLARELGFSQSDAATLGLAAQLHDVGKIGLPDSILLKPARLTIQEYETVKKHCDIGQHIVQPLSDAEWKSLRQCSETDFSVNTPSGDPLLVMIANIARSHHERWNGAGYPRGLKGDEIPLESRITSVADVFDALTTKRPYKPAFDIPKVVKMIALGRGTQFDPQVVDALDRCIGDIVQISQEQAD